MISTGCMVWVFLEAGWWQHSITKKQGQGSGRQVLNLAGESPVASMTRFRCVVMPQFVLGNHMFIAWCISPSCLVAGVVEQNDERCWEISTIVTPYDFTTDKTLTTVGTTRGTSEYGSLNMSEWLQPRKIFVIEVVMMTVQSCAELLWPRVRPMLSGKKRVKAPEKHSGVLVQAPLHRLRR